MAFDNSPAYSENLALDGLTMHQFLVIALDTAKELNWLTTDISESGLVNSTRNGLYTWNAEIKVQIEPEQAIIRSSTANHNVHETGDENQKTVQKFIERFNALKSSYTIEQLEQKYEELKIDFTDTEENVPDKPRRSFEERVNSFISLFKPKPGYFITPIIVYLNVGVFILMIASGVSPILPKNEDLLNWGANFRPYTTEGQWWRLISCCFLHIGIFHLFLNMYALVYIGLLLEPRLGRTRFATAYLLTGIASSVTSLLWHDRTISAGASGAIFGLYGVFLAMLTTNLIEKEIRLKLLRSIGIFVIYNLVYGMRGGIDNAAHLGGLISGLFIGYAFYPSIKNTASIKLKYGTCTVLAILIGASSFVAYSHVPVTDATKFQYQLTQFTKLEEKAMQVYKLPKGSRKNLLLEALVSGDSCWNQAINLLNNLDRLNLPDDLRHKNNLLINYCNLRLKSYHFIYTDIDENTTMYHDSVTFYDNKVLMIINELKEKDKK